MSALYDAEIGKCLVLPRFDFDWINGSEKPYSPELRELCEDANFIHAVESGVDAKTELDAVCSFVGKTHPATFNGLACIRDEYCSQTAKGKTVSMFAKMARMAARDGPRIENMDRGPDC